MNYLLQLKDMNVFDAFVIIILIVLVGKFLYELFIEDIIIKYGWESKKMREKREDHELLIKTSKNLALLQEKSEKEDRGLEIALEVFIEEVRESFNDVNEKFEEFNEIHAKERNQTLEVQQYWSDKIDNVFEKLDEMQKDTNERFEESEEKQNKRVQSDIKERIAQSYRRYNSAKKITRMELESLEDLITTYEEHKGFNSFVHSVVQKDMYTWELVE